VSLVRRVEEWLGTEGGLPSRWPRWEHRLAQRQLAGDIARALEQGGVLLAEAPTGVGKSLAYLLPSVFAVLEREERVVIATCTRSLQDQLFERDLPALLEALRLEVPVVRLKGKQNYLCPRALELADGQGSEENETLEALRRWAGAEREGDLDRFPAPDAEAFRRVRGRVATDPAACTAATCRRGRECFWMRARRNAQQARIVVVNHALLALSGEVEGLLPDFDLLVVDEAHRLEGVLLSQLERTVSRNRFEEALRLIGTGRRGGAGLLTRLRGYALPLFAKLGTVSREDEVRDAIETLARRVTVAREDIERLFAALEPTGRRHELYGLRERYRAPEDLLGRELEPLDAAMSHCSGFALALGRLAESTLGLGGDAAEELSAELEEVGGRFAMLGRDLEVVAMAGDPDWVYWRSAGGRGVELHGAPVSVGEHARRLVIGRARAAVLTSATLSSGGDFEFLADRLGLGEAQRLPFEAVSYPSPFPLAEQMRVYVYDGGEDEAEAVSKVSAALRAAAPRNQLLLFTAHERLRRARARLLQRLPADARLLAQEWDGSASVVAEQFRDARGAILLGVQSLWEGVDFPGESLEILVVAKLPFSVPDDPRVEARAERLRDRGLDPFRNDLLPEAVLRFRQGVGRLIRRADDRGVLVVCDPRLARSSYRAPFLAALPVAPGVHNDAEALARDAAAFLESRPQRVEESV